ncbi:transporter substrate-binding domain-containing protein [Fluoribacter gormanii]|uniref:ABC transporter arginine-binding protein 1 n=1 Tax=Fluoribacter gormanii TaxID=464 RepID=A0A377GH61_9GAMM|nr:transporter substrate-binding domain-containing protein [Fluoribacter gormanii]KTD03755.1 arginine ABC transporter substrate-binding protein [Fluoribacter gormanii]MCW8444613.1 transporter substrate-binding domain-containing protein [Fluoribacter gormanii]MCW8469803.1 transporter substrate-binding domain-containing protein [Fluoribacter gormanii]SIR82091.1 amino acid ABC transporter substrate-binding protein, PAAT family [Fluoribacter gormanii]STO23875.1 ABC transporter arginine-binding pro
MIRLILIAFICSTSALFAQGEPLNVGIESFDPPFVMQGTHNEAYGFDVDMMNSLCKIMNRTCAFHVMRFAQLIDAVANKKLDVAVSSITITSDRAKIVNFSLPYLLSYSRFLERKTIAKEAFSLELLNTKTIGLESGTVFLDQLTEMGVKNPNIKEYSGIEDQLTALARGDVDIILMDNATAVYWASNSSDSFKLTGPPYMYGNGYGIAVNPADPDLLTQLNQALVQFQNSEDYKLNYNKYLFEF